MTDKSASETNTDDGDVSLRTNAAFTIIFQVN